MALEFFVRKMTDNMESGIIRGWLVAEGDYVEEGQPVIEIETDKATVELEAPVAGILKGIRAGAEAGATVPVGETIAFIAELGEEVPVLPPLSSSQKPVSSSMITQKPQVGEAPVSSPDQPLATPVVRRLAREMEIELSLVRGSGPHGRVTKEDLLIFAEKHTRKTTRTGQTGGTEQPVKRDDSTPDDQWLDLTPIQRITGERMVASVQTVPQFSLNVRADMTNCLQAREDALAGSSDGEAFLSLSITAIVVKAVALALQAYPRANGSFVEGRVRLNKQINIGVALGTEDGLFVAVTREADRRSLSEIDQNIRSFQQKAAEMRFDPVELTGSTFTISNLGMHGIDQFSAIINPPESAILAVGGISRTPVAMPDGSIEVRPLMSLTLSIDHRVMDGLQGAQLLSRIKELLQQPDFICSN
jgi:pyruvate dehydrogenase E2 component (dihydrolipoamide acetyltransferase)